MGRSGITNLLQHDLGKMGAVLNNAIHYGYPKNDPTHGTSLNGIFVIFQTTGFQVVIFRHQNMQIL